jgi:phenylalanyl-tRNA synthetase beta chain
VAIAGVMGGQNSEIDDTTTDIVLESAYFDPSSIRRTAKALGLNTDASYRFERGVDIGNVLGAMQRAVDLITQYAGGVPSTVSELIRGESLVSESLSYESLVLESLGLKSPIRCRYARMRGVNGIDVDDNTIRLMLSSIGCDVVSEDAESVTVRIPTWRVDITSEIDLAEEVMRLHGINNVPAAEMARLNMTGQTLAPSVRALGGMQGLHTRNAIRTKLVARGYSDCVTSVLTSPETAAIGNAAVITLKNALGTESSALRTSMIPGLLVSASRNLRHGAEHVRLMEIGQVFANDPAAELGVTQQERLVLLVAGTTGRHWSAPDREVDLYDVLGDLGVVDSIKVAAARGMADGVWSMNTVDVFVSDTLVGKAGQLEPMLTKAFDVDEAVYVVELDLRASLRVSLERKSTYKPVGQYPTVKRDLAVIVDEQVSAASLIEVVSKSAGKDIYRSAEVFDVFRDEQHVGAGMKSMAVNITFRSDERTLVDEEIDASIRAIIEASQRELGARVRGEG